jgi:hypothetical protein
MVCGNFAIALIDIIDVMVFSRLEGRDLLPLQFEHALKRCIQHLTRLLKQTMILEDDLTFNDQDATHAHSSTGWPIKVSIQHRAFQSNQLRYLPHWDQLGC